MSVSNLTVKLAGVARPIKLGSFSFGGRIDERDRCAFTVRDDNGTLRFPRGTLVEVTDDNGTQFTGQVWTDKRTKVAGQSMVWHEIDCVDNQVYADGRTGKKLYKNQFAGVIAADLTQGVLAAEGITAAAALDIDSTQADFAAGTLSGTVAASNIDDGDLELAESGTSWNHDGVLMGGITLPSFNAIKFQATCLSGFTNPYLYRKILAPSYTVVSGDNFTYDVWVQSDSPQIKCGMDIVFSDGTTLRDNGNANDSHGIASHPSNDLSGLANDQWYTRSFGLGAFTGKSIKYISIVFEGDNPGTYTAYIRRCWVINGSTHKVDVVTDSTTSLATNVLLANNGYINDSLSVVQAHDKTRITFYNIDLSPIVTVANAYIAWAEPTLPTGAQFYHQTSVDVGSSRQAVTNGAPVGNLIPGAKCTGQNLFIWKYSVQGVDPTALTQVPDSRLFVRSAPANTISGADVRAKYDLNTEWDTGTYSGLKSGGQSNLLMAGYAVPFATTSDYSGTTFWGTGSPFAFISNSLLAVQATTGDARIRLDPYGAWRQDFIAEVDVLVSPSIQIGIEYRTSNWGNGANSFAYVAHIIPVSANVYKVELGRGSNSGNTAGSYVTVANATNVKFTDNSWHHLKLQVSGNTHTIFVDDFQYVSIADSTHANTNNIALRVFSSSGLQTGFFKNYGILPIALSGTWTSPTIGISGAGTYGKSAIVWDNTQSKTDGLTFTPTGTSIKVEATTDGGTTWTAVNNGDPIPLLTSGQSLASKLLQLRVTLATQNASSQPTLGGLSVWVAPPYSATGTRISPTLALNDAGRAGATLIAWNAITPTGTGVVVESSLDNGATWSSDTNGGSIPGIAGASQTIDSFDTNTSSSYTSTFATGGSAATWTWDTVNSRLVASGGTNAYLKRNSFSALDQRVIFDMDRSENAGAIIRLDAFNDFYILAVCDDSAVSHANTLALFKQVGSSVFMLTSYNTIDFKRGTPHRFVFEMVGGQMTAYMDGALITSFFDASAITGTSAGLFNNGGVAQFYTVRFEAFGDDLTGKSVKTRVTLTSTDPSATPQLLDLTVAALGPQIGIGALMEEADCRNKYVTDCFNELAEASDYLSTIKSDKSLVFQARETTPSPWILDSRDELLLLDLDVTTNGDLYRNQMTLTGVIDTVSFTEEKVGDGTSTSWTLGYNLTEAPTITLNGQAVTVGEKGQTGFQYYWEPGSNSISQDSSQTVLQSFDVLAIAGVGEVETTVTIANTSIPGTITQSQYATIVGGTGIVEMVEDVSGKGKTVAAATDYINAQLQRYGVMGDTLTFKTRRDGLTITQFLPVFMPEHGLNDEDMLITSTSIDAIPTVDPDTGEEIWEYWTSVTATNGPNAGSYWKLIAANMKK